MLPIDSLYQGYAINPDGNFLDRGDAGEVVVQLRAGSSAKPEELIGFVKEHLGSVKAPKAVHLVEDLPRSTVGKVLRRNVRLCSTPRPDNL